MMKKGDYDPEEDKYYVKATCHNVSSEDLFPIGRIFE